MKVINHLVSILLFAAGFRASDVASNVLDLTEATFDDAIVSGLIMVEFFAPWCGHCKALAPKYEEAADTLAKLYPDTPVKLAKVDCTENASVCEKQGVRGYPTLKVFNDGNASSYEKAREADAIVSFMKAQLQPTISTLDKDSFKSFTTDNKVSIVAFFADQESEAFKTFSEVAKKHRNDFSFGSISDAELAKEHGVSDGNIVLFKTFDEGKNVYDGELTTDAIFEFIKSSSIPLLAELTPENFQGYMEAKKPIAYIFTDNEEDRASYEENLKEIAKETREKVSFVFINATLYGRHAESINLKAEFPTFAIQEIEPVGKFPIDQSEALSADRIIKHVRDYVSGSLKPSAKSQPIPEPSEDPLIVLVGDNFAEVAYDTTKDVFVEFYASWCGHCKKLAPIYAELAKLYKDKKHIVIANFEAIENDLPYKTPFEIQGFPTIKLFKAGSNEVIDFDGDRTLEGFVEFLKANASDADVEIEAPEETPEEEEEKDEL